GDDRHPRGIHAEQTTRPARRPAAAARAQAHRRGERDAARIHQRGAARIMSARHIGSRGSDRALWQSRTVLAALNASGAPGWSPEITKVTTRGDVDQSPYLAGGVEKGFFTKELEIALLE